jgi:hypothetical protein
MRHMSSEELLKLWSLPETHRAPSIGTLVCGDGAVCISSGPFGDGGGDGGGGSAGDDCMFGVVGASMVVDASLVARVRMHLAIYDGDPEVPHGQREATTPERVRRGVVVAACGESGGDGGWDTVSNGTARLRRTSSDQSGHDRALGGGT